MSKLVEEWDSVLPRFLEVQRDLAASDLPLAADIAALRSQLANVRLRVAANLLPTLRISPTDTDKVLPFFEAPMKPRPRG